MRLSIDPVCPTPASAARHSALAGAPETRQHLGLAVGVLRDRLAALRAQVGESLRRDFGAAHVSYEQQAEMRYKGQRHAIRVALAESDDVAAIRRKFLDSYRQRYGRADAEGAVDSVVKALTCGG